jgi:hypothetical protein
LTRIRIIYLAWGFCGNRTRNCRLAMCTI